MNWVYPPPPPPGFCGVCIVQSLIFCVQHFVDHFMSFLFWPLNCLSIFWPLNCLSILSDYMFGVFKLILIVHIFLFFINLLVKLTCWSPLFQKWPNNISISDKIIIIYMYFMPSSAIFSAVKFYWQKR